MSDPLMTILASATGLFLGAFFFGGLWWTVRAGVASPRPALWFLGSLLVRMGVVLVGFYWVGGGQWPRLLGALLGFVCARFIVLWLTRAPAESLMVKAKETHHAP